MLAYYYLGKVRDNVLWTYAVDRELLFVTPLHADSQCQHHYHISLPREMCINASVPFCKASYSVTEALGCWLPPSYTHGHRGITGLLSKLGTGLPANSLAGLSPLTMRQAPTCVVRPLPAAGVVQVTMACSFFSWAARDLQGEKEINTESHFHPSPSEEALQLNSWWGMPGSICLDLRYQNFLPVLTHRQSTLYRRFPKHPYHIAGPLER